MRTMNEKPPTVRKCRALEMYGWRSPFCKRRIDNGNWFFCSACHKAISKLEARDHPDNVYICYHLDEYEPGGNETIWRRK